MSEAKHTRGELQAGLDLPEVANNDPDKRIVWRDSLAVADCRSPWLSIETAEANAARIALTWNCHDELLAACKVMLCELGYLYDQTKSREGGSVWKARVAGREAIAKAEEARP